MAAWIPLNILLASFFVHGVLSDSREIKYMNLLCGKTIRINDAVRIILEPYMVSKMPDDCEVHLQAYRWLYKHDAQIFIELSFLELNFDCEHGLLEILQLGNYDDRLTSASGDTVCGEEIPEQIYRSTHDTLTLKFYKKIPTVYSAAFEILATKIDTSYCSELEEFRCSNDVCVNRTVICDGYNNCRDESDESDRECIGFWTPAAISGVAVGSVAGILLVGLMIVVYRKIMH